MTDPKYLNFENFVCSLIKIRQTYIYTRNSFTDFNVLIDNKSFFDQPIENKQEVHKNPVKMPRTDNYTTVNLLAYSHHQSYYKLIGIDVSRKANTSIPKQFVFVGKLEENNVTTMFFIAAKQQKSVLSLSLDLLIVTE